MVIAMFLLMVHQRHTPKELAPWCTLMMLELMVEGIIFSLLCY